MPYPRALEGIQWAREAVKGTDLAATSQMVVEDFVFSSDSEYARPKTARGLLLRNRGHETIVQFGANWKANGPLNYEQFQNWLTMAVQGAVVPTGAGPYIWTFTRPITANPALDSFTIEKRETDGATPYTHVGHYALASALRLSGAPGELVMMEIEGFCRKLQTGETYTPALSMPTPEMPPFALTKVYIDSTWANLGVTQVSSQVISYDFEHLTGCHPRFTADGRTELDFNTHEFNPDDVAVNASVTCLLGAQYGTEQTAAGAGTLRAVRLQFDGSGGRQLQVDFLAKYERPELPEFGEDGGQRVVQLNFMDTTDGTNFLRFKLTNNVATLI